MSNAFSSASTLCDVAQTICQASFVIPEAEACAGEIANGQADAGAIEDAANAWRDASKQMKQAHDDLSNIVSNIPDSEWKATSRELYEQKAQQYLQQLETSSTAAEVAGDILTGVAAAFLTFAVFAMAIATEIGIDAVAVAAADATIIGAPEAEAEAAADGAAMLAALQGANEVLTVALTTAAGVFGAGTAVDAGFQVAQGDTSAVGDFGQAVLQTASGDLQSYIENGGGGGSGGGEGGGEGGGGDGGEGGGDGSPPPSGGGGEGGGTHSSSSSSEEGGSTGEHPSSSSSSSSSSSEEGGSSSHHSSSSSSSSEEGGSSGSSGSHSSSSSSSEGGSTSSSSSHSSSEHPSEGSSHLGGRHRL
jgi:hypothetical protein